MAVSYKYKAVDAMGRVIEAEFIAKTKEEVLSMIREKGLTPIKVQEEEQKSKDVGEMSLFQSKVKIKDISIFCKQLSWL